MGSDDPIKGSCLLEICQVHLLYIGQHMYGELKICPFVPIIGPVFTEAPTNFTPLLDKDSESVEARFDKKTRG